MSSASIASIDTGWRLVGMLLPSRPKVSLADTPSILTELKRGFWPLAEIEPDARSTNATRGSRRMKSWMLPLIEGSALIASWSTLVPEPILVEENTEVPAVATACTVPRVATSLFSCASIVFAVPRVRYTFSSVSLPAPALLMVTVYGPPTRRPRAL